MTTVVSVRGRDRAELLADKSFLYVGRKCAGWPASIWGNPFRGGMPGIEAGQILNRLPVHVTTRNTMRQIGRFETLTVEQAVACYVQWVEHQPSLMARLHELEDRTLGCWCGCYPQNPNLQCHAVSLARMVNPVERDLFGPLNP